MWIRRCAVLVLLVAAAGCIGAGPESKADRITSTELTPSTLQTPCGTGLGETKVTVGFDTEYGVNRGGATVTVSGHTDLVLLRGEAGGTDQPPGAPLEISAPAPDGSGHSTVDFFVVVDEQFQGPPHTLEVRIALDDENADDVTRTLEITSDCVTAAVDPEVLDFSCDPPDTWSSAACTVELTGDWGASPSMTLVNPTAGVRVVVGTETYDASSPDVPLVPGTNAFTVQVDPTAIIPSPFTLRFYTEDGIEGGESDLTLSVACPTCTPETVGPLLFEWHPDFMTSGQIIGVSDGTSAREWTILNDWLVRSGNSRVGSPDISPDGKYLAFTVGTGAIYVLDLQATPATDPIRITPLSGYAYRDLEWSHTQLTLPDAPAGSDPTYVLACGRRDLAGVFALKITLLAVPADPKDIVQAAGSVLTSPSTDHVDPTWAPDDSRVAYQDLSDRSLRSVLVDGTDDKLELATAQLPPSSFDGVNFPRWHPTDIDRIAFHHGNGAVYVFHRSTGVLQQYTPTSGRYGAAWTRFGAGLVYLQGLSNLTLLCDEDKATETTLVSLPGAEVYFIRIPSAQAAIEVLNEALANP